jgi:hypothetical protein
MAAGRPRMAPSRSSLTTCTGLIRHPPRLSCSPSGG